MLIEKTFKPEGVCCKEIKLVYSDNTKTIESVEFIGGCKGWSTACSKLLVKMPFDYVISYLQGIKCGNRQTSCPDQLVKFIQTIYC